MQREVARRGKWRKPFFGGSDDLQGRFLLPKEVGSQRKVEGRLRWEGSTVNVYVRNPPRKGSYEHECCLQLIKDGWFRIHFYMPPTNVESAVMFTEDFLYRCWRGY